MARLKIRAQSDDYIFSYLREATVANFQKIGKS